VLEGIVVLELSQVFAGPLAARLLAEMGATVIKVERPSGDVSRQQLWRVNGRSGYFVQQNRGKYGVALDLRLPEGVELLWKLVERADVLIDGFGPGVLQKFGFTYETMSARNERIIVCELSALGRSGELGAVRGYDQVGACYSGVAYTSSDGSGGPSIMPSVALGDSAMGLSAYAGILSALYAARDTGRGQRVDVSLVDAYIQSHSSNLEAYSLSGGQINARPVDGQNAYICPAGVFKTADDRELYIVAMSNHEWVRLAQCIGRPELGADPRYESNEARIAHRPEVLALLNEWLAGFATRDAAVDVLRKAGVVSAPVLDIGEVIENPHLRARGTVEMIQDPALGEFAVPGPPFRLSASRRAELRPAPDLGRDNQEIFVRFGGLTEDELRHYAEVGALTADSPPGVDTGAAVTS
jgi:crotonobetainyl-CoA:carnitine CoA-transferase CaiB-like acyl-CoA transferase